MSPGGSILGIIKQSPIATITQNLPSLPLPVPSLPVVTGRDLVKSLVAHDGGPKSITNTNNSNTTNNNASTASHSHSASRSTATMATAKSRSVLLEPIVEEVFEYSRYDPITGNNMTEPSLKYELIHSRKTIRSS